MKDVVQIENYGDEKKAYFECPGCGMAHASIIERKDGRIKGAKDEICHSFVTDGKIRFLNDCTHDLAGQTVDLKPIE